MSATWRFDNGPLVGSADGLAAAVGGVLSLYSLMALDANVGCNWRNGSIPMITRVVLALLLGFTPVAASAQHRLTNEEIDRRATEVPPGNPENEADYQRWLRQKQQDDAQKKQNDRAQLTLQCLKA